ncbi:MAG: MBL fold metallo-hydrolase [Desulfatitalea sp.]|nr:MBL fold metallo-hydrolase [Desulfatitalea sp.]NNJ99846.1 MBL fold metallo-hydrolase [Desulfatitalea sp.]
MKIEQMRLGRMRTFGYLIGDEVSGNAALIDPAFDTADILHRANQSGYNITHVLNTHHHADHTAGNKAVIKVTGALLCIHASDAPALSGLINRATSRMLGGRRSPSPDRLLTDGDKLHVGTIELTILHTPGHTPGGICIHTPGHVFTGDTLFVGAIGRADLPGSSAEQLLAAIHRKLYTLPDETIVWPGHDYGDRPSSIVGHERQHNPYTR